MSSSFLLLTRRIWQELKKRENKSSQTIDSPLLIRVPQSHFLSHHRKKIVQSRVCIVRQDTWYQMRLTLQRIWTISRMENEKLFSIRSKSSIQQIIRIISITSFSRVIDNCIPLINKLFRYGRRLRAGNNVGEKEIGLTKLQRPCCCTR